MMSIPQRLFRSDTVHRNITNDPFNGLLTCGFLHKKPGAGRYMSDINLCFDYYGCLLVLSGNGTHVDSEGTSWPVSQGSFIQRIPGRIHSTHIQPDGLWLEFYICIGRDLFETLVRLRILDARKEVLTPGVTPALLSRMEALLESCRRAGDAELPVLLAEAQHILFTVMRMHRESQDMDPSADWVDRACRLMGEIAGGTGGHISVEEVARFVGVGLERFRKGFRARTGMPPAEYLRMRRMNAAQSMLADGHRCVSEVALALGFPDAFTFSRQFRKVVGIPPSQFQKLY